jgi:hypothetical protein
MAGTGARVTILLLAVAAYVVARPDPFLVTPELRYGPPLMYQDAPAVASGNGQYLAAWIDDRDGYYSGQLLLVAARIRSDGVLLDSAGIVLREAAGEFGEEGSIAVGWDGTNFLVVWEEELDLASHYDVFACRVSGAGVLLDSSPIAIVRAPEQQSMPGVAFDGTNYFVVWTDYREEPNHPFGVWGTFVSTDGVVLDTAGFLVVGEEVEDPGLPLLFDGEKYCFLFTVWQGATRPDIGMVRITTDGRVLDSVPIPVCVAESGQYSPAAAFDGSNILVVWTDRHKWQNSGADIRGRRITPEGVIVDTTFITVCDASGNQAEPHAVWAGSSFIVSWTDQRGGDDDVYAARVSSHGVVQDPNGFALATGQGTRQEQSVLANIADRVLCIWRAEDHYWYGDLRGLHFPAQVPPSDTWSGLVSSSGRSQSTPSVAFDGTNYLVVWQELCERTSADIYACRVTPDGRILDPAGIAVAATEDYDELPRVAACGDRYLVVWTRLGTDYTWSARGCRVGLDGTVLDPQSIVLAPGQVSFDPAVSADSGNWFVVWTDARTGGGETRVYGTRVSRDGELLDPQGVQLSYLAGRQWTPAAVCWNGADYLVAWDHDTRQDESHCICGTRVTPQAVVLDSPEVSISRPSFQTYCPDVASNGRDWLVTWQDGGYEFSAIAGARVSAAGTVLDTASIVIGHRFQWFYSLPRVTHKGSEYHVAWDGWTHYYHHSIFGARVSEAGLVVDTFAICDEPRGQYQPALTHGPESQLACCWSGWAASAAGRPANARRIWLVLDSLLAGTAGTSRSTVTRQRPQPTIVRGVLRAADSGQDAAYRAELLDVSGRKVLDLRPGVNDVRPLAPGIYFVHQTSSVERDASRVTKVIVTR